MSEPDAFNNGIVYIKPNFSVDVHENLRRYTSPEDQIHAKYVAKLIKNKQGTIQQHNVRGSGEEEALVYFPWLELSLDARDRAIKPYTSSTEACWWILKKDLSCTPIVYPATQDQKNNLAKALESLTKIGN
jgi:hypothetical protein